MKLHHKKPCKQCPWLKDSPQGFLGGNDPVVYTDIVMLNQVPACHMRDRGEESDETAMCAGALATAANACILPFKRAEAAAKRAVGQNSKCFKHPRDFYLYHAEEEYVQPYLREVKEDERQT